MVVGRTRRLRRIVSQGGRRTRGDLPGKLGTGKAKPGLRRRDRRNLRLAAQLAPRLRVPVLRRDSRPGDTRRGDAITLSPTDLLPGDKEQHMVSRYLRLGLTAALITGAFVVGNTGIAAAARRQLPSVPSCNGSPVARPRAIQVTECGGSQPKSVTGIRWYDWTSQLAVGVGTFHRRLCTPNCAAGTELSFPAVIALSHPVGLFMPKDKDSALIFDCVTVVSPGTKTLTTCNPASGSFTTGGWGTYSARSGQ